ncbi:hypothetical protein TA3x_000407 [Tundrisphaera sp. TA3]|uniref:hypothetical protein n=1 Tax=Tundrisphaera sp. TA3 TaxID=3435775 RepID=UPI003EB7FFEA
MEDTKHTPGPWAWFGTASCEDLWLGTAHSGRIYVMGFKRWGRQGAQPIFQVKGKGMVPAKELVQFEVGNREVVGMTQAKSERSVYRHHVRGIAHPDARLIAAAPELLEALEDVLSKIEQANLGHILGNTKGYAAIAKAKGKAA